MKKIFIFLLFSTILFFSAIFISLTSEDIEWFMGTEWQKNTKAIKKELSTLPNGFSGQISVRYEGSDFVNVWGPNDEFISFGSILPKAFIVMECGKIHQIGSLLIQCSNSVNKQDHSNFCLNDTIKDNRKPYNIKTIIEDYKLISEEIEKLPSSFEDQYFTKSEQVCWAIRDNNIPVKRNN